MTVQLNFDWQDLAFGSKKPINLLKATFIAAPREISASCFKRIVKKYLPGGNIVLGLAKEEYITGFNRQPQFKTLQPATVGSIIDKVNHSNTKHKIYTLTYSQRELKYLLEKLEFKQVLLVNGSWQYAFHNSDAFYVLSRRQIPFSLIPAFTDEQEAKAYEKSHHQKLILDPGPYLEEEMLAFAGAVAELSYDYNYQTGAVLGKKTRTKYRYLTQGFNKVVPYQTYAMLHGSEREKHYSPPNDLNYYDTIHAETALLLNAAKQNISLKNTTLFINLMPCPTCARILSQTEISEIIYSLDHSDGYAGRMLEACGKKVRRVI